MTTIFGLYIDVSFRDLAAMAIEVLKMLAVGALAAWAVAQLAYAINDIVNGKDKGPDDVDE